SFFFFQAEDGIRDFHVTGVQTCALPIYCQLETNYHFGGYAKLKPELLAFISAFTQRTGIPLDPIYTGKMMFGIYDMIMKGRFERSEERRVGKECRSRGTPYQYKEKRERQ